MIRRGGPVYLVTTCRHATPPVRRLAKELVWSLGFARRVNRGRMSLSEVIARAGSLGAWRLLIVGRGLHGNPGLIRVIGTRGNECGETLLAMRLRGVVFGGLKRMPPAPESLLPVVSLNENEELAEELALSLATVYLGTFTVDELRGFTSFTRVVAVEKIGKKDFVAVVKFLERGKDFGPKLLVKSFTSKWSGTRIS